MTTPLIKRAITQIPFDQTGSVPVQTAPLMYMYMYCIYTYMMPSMCMSGQYIYMYMYIHVQCMYILSVHV